MWAIKGRLDLLVKYLHVYLFIWVSWSPNLRIRLSIHECCHSCKFLSLFSSRIPQIWWWTGRTNYRKYTGRERPSGQYSVTKKRILQQCSCFIEIIKRVGKSDKTRGLPSFLSLFRNEFNKFNKTRAQMLDSIYHMTLRLLWNLISGVKKALITLFGL